MIIEFTKMQGLGNDFVVIDAIRQQISLDPEHIRFIADRHFGVGCDQLLLVESAQDSDADFCYRIFNADGSEVAQCGNGARCFARFIRDKKLSAKDKLLVDTHAGQLLLTFDDDGLITVNMGVPQHKPALIPLQTEQEEAFYTVQLDDEEQSFGAVSLGNPHAVLQVADVLLAAVEEIGAALESHAFFPERANIGFMQVCDRNNIKLRVFERGAGETLACGSGACAAVVIGVDQGILANDVRVELPGGQLKISWQGREYPVFMTGPAISVFEGKIEL